jgi:mRNA interferase RelE/StbE
VQSYRLRIGRYQVIFAEDGVTILALHVGKRDTIIYRKN